MSHCPDDSSVIPTFTQTHFLSSPRFHSSSSPLRSALQFVLNQAQGQAAKGGVEEEKTSHSWRNGPSELK